MLTQKTKMVTVLNVDEGTMKLKLDSSDSQSHIVKSKINRRAAIRLASLAHNQVTCLKTFAIKGLASSDHILGVKIIGSTVPIVNRRR